jgi:hypothetical protein
MRLYGNIRRCSLSGTELANVPAEAHETYGKIELLSAGVNRFQDARRF